MRPAAEGVRTHAPPPPPHELGGGDAGASGSDPKTMGHAELELAESVEHEFQPIYQREAA